MVDALLSRVRHYCHAMTAINGQQLPPRPQELGGRIERNATQSTPYWPLRVVPPKDAPNVPLIMIKSLWLLAAALYAAQEPQLEQALAGYARAVAADPKSEAANNGAGMVLDLLGRYAEAHKYFAQAIKAAPTPLAKAQAQRAMAISYAFAGDCRGAEKYDSAAYDFFQSANDFYNAGETANELGRICLDSGDIQRAYEWYRRGYDAGVQEENLPAARADLWKFRWAHARARIAARRGSLEEATKYVAAAKAILDKGTNPDQKIYMPYLAGYVAFYGGDYHGALVHLKNSNQGDPFIQCLIAESYEKLGDPETAREYYRMVTAAAVHSVPAAFARPFAIRKLQSSGGVKR